MPHASPLPLPPPSPLPVLGPRARALLLATLLAAAVAGCAAPDADATLPGVRTTSTITDAFSCDPLLFPHGCVIVRIEKVDSGCRPEVPGYVRCDATVWWNASSGTAAAGPRLATTVNGTAGPSCTPMPGAPCVARGNVSFVHAFDGPGQEAPWNLTFEAWLDGAPPGAGGSFTLRVAMLVRAQPADAADA